MQLFQSVPESGGRRKREAFPLSAADDFVIRSGRHGVDDDVERRKSREGADQAVDKGFYISHGQHGQQPGDDGEGEGGVDPGHNKRQEENHQHLGADKLPDLFPAGSCGGKDEKG